MSAIQVDFYCENKYRSKYKPYEADIKSNNNMLCCILVGHSGFLTIAQDQRVKLGLRGPCVKTNKQKHIWKINHVSLIYSLIKCFSSIPF